MHNSGAVCVAGLIRCGWLFEICIAIVINPHGEEARQAPSRTMEARHSFSGLHPSRRLLAQAPQDEGLERKPNQGLRG